MKMSSKARVLAAYKRLPVDRLPVISPTSVATVESMEITGAAFPKAHTDAVKTAALASAGHGLLGFDNVAPYFSVQQEAAALGAGINWGNRDTMPSAISHPYQNPDDFILPSDFLDRLPIKTVLDSIRILKAQYGDEVAISGKVMGPWTLSYNLYGVENFLVDLLSEPETAKGFLQAFKQITITFALAQIEAGIDMLTWADHATGDMVSADTYEEFLLPVHKECVFELKSKMPRWVPITLHTCGKTLDRMPLFAQTGFDAFHFDPKNDPAEALKAVGEDILLGFDFAAVDFFFVWQVVKERAFAAGQVCDLLPLVGSDAVNHPCAECVGREELPLFDLLFSLGEIMIVSVINIVKPVQTADAGVAIENLNRHHVLAVSFQSVKALLIERLSVRQADFYAACFVFQYFITPTRKLMEPENMLSRLHLLKIFSYTGYLSRFYKSASNKVVICARSSGRSLATTSQSIARSTFS